MTKKLSVAVSVVLSLGTLFAAPAMAQDTTPPVATVESLQTPSGLLDLTPNDRITRLYRAALGREPDADGHAYWVQQIANGVPLTTLTRALIESEEAKLRSSGDTLRDAYLWALGREPDEAGYAYWIQFDTVHAVLLISDSAEHRSITGAEVVMDPSIAEELAPSVPSGWVNAGHGVYVPPVLLAIRWCESQDNYLAANRRSSARGAYQFLASSWASYGHARRYGVFEAHMATPAQQDEAALLTWQREGTRPWNSSRSCWS